MRRVYSVGCLIWGQYKREGYSTFTRSHRSPDLVENSESSEGRGEGRSILPHAFSPFLS